MVEGKGVRNMLRLISAGLAPGLALLSYFYLKDSYRPEPLRHVLKMFIVGAFLVFPTMALQHALRQGVGDIFIFDSYITIALTEEFLKFFFLYHLAFKHPGFKEPYDGIVYAVAIALGFASAENIFYLLINGIELAWLRAIIPVSGHALFGVFMGYYLGKFRFRIENKRSRSVILAIVSPVIAHGSLDFLLLYTDLYWIWFVVPFMLFLWVAGLKRVKMAHERSPYAPNQSVGQIK